MSMQVRLGKLLKAGAGLNLFIFVMVLSGIGLKIYTLFLGIAFILFVSSIITIKKGLNIGRYFGMTASLIMILVFLIGFFNTVRGPSGLVFVFPSILDILVPGFYGILFIDLINKEL